MFPDSFACDGFRLRLVRPADAEALFGFLNRPEVIEPTSSDGWTLEGLRTFGEENLSGAFSGKWARYAIITEEGRLLGSVGLFNVDSRHNRVEIGYDLSPEAWGHGWMTRAAGALVEWALTDGRFHRVEATVMLGNRRSERVLEKLGFEREGLMRGFKLVRGEYRDYSLWARLAEGNERERGGA